MRRHSFFFRLFIGNLLLVAVIIAIGCAVSYQYIHNEYAVRDRQHQRQELATLQVFFEQNWTFDAQTIDAYCRRLAQAGQRRLTVIAADGRVLGETEANWETMRLHTGQHRPEIAAAVEGRIGEDVRVSQTVQRQFRYMAAPVRQGSTIVGIIRLAMPVHAVAEASGFIRNAVIGSAVVAVLAATMMGLLISWVWSRPVREITRSAARIASGDLTGRTSVAGPREMAELAAALNEMRRSLAGQIELIASQRGDLQTVVANLREGLLVLDGRRRIVLMNRSAADLLRVEPADAAGKHVQDAVRLPAVLALLDELNARAVEPTTAAAATVSRQIEIDLAGRRAVLNLQAARLAPAASRTDHIDTLLVVRDVTDAARAAAMKAEFVANASHELRTPLATIRAAVDSLAMVEPEDKAGFQKLQTILDRHVRRLEDMTNDLLDLHLVEQPADSLDLQEVPLGTLVRWAQDHFSAQAAERGIILSIEASPSDSEFVTNRRLLQLIWQNLIDNAIKFTPAGGKVDARLTMSGDSVILCVADTGLGIAPEVQARVFERFFQVDASRSGKYSRRGTGLGLAIVKYACERLGAKISLQSALGAGTTVKVVVPAPHGP